MRIGLNESVTVILFVAVFLVPGSPAKENQQQEQFETLRAYQLEKLIDLRSAWTVRPGESVEGVKGRKIIGVAASCAEVKDKLEHRRRTLRLFVGSSACLFILTTVP